MRKWLKRIALVLVVLLSIPLIFLVWEQLDHQTLSRRVRNERLHTIKPDWPGNALDQRERFFDERNPYLPKTIQLLKWRFGDRPFEEEKRGDIYRLEVRDPRDFLASGRDGILWLGHASFYIRIGDTGILIDPVFGDPRFIRRWMDVPSPLEHISDVDYVLVSHDHRDHMDEPTLRAIAAKFPKASFYAGLRSEDVLNEWVTPTNGVQTAGWFQRFDTGDPRVNIYFHPVRHWSRRSLLDTNWRLWGSYIIDIGGTTIYHGGDSGYAGHYREAGELFPEIDYFLVAIGSYEPRWFMEPNHTNPADAVQGFVDSGARIMIPMHYATFDMSDEPPSQPLRLTMEEARKKGVGDRVRPLAVNEALLLNATSVDAEQAPK
jgi:L-ascorbate metabolism protein UlaG (beta-lactamase superfamily)